MNPKVILIFSVIIIGAMVGGSWLLTRNQADLGVPDAKIFSKVEALETVANLGEMKVADVGTKDF